MKSKFYASICSIFFIFAVQSQFLDCNQLVRYRDNELYYATYSIDNQIIALRGKCNDLTKSINDLESMQRTATFNSAKAFLKIFYDNFNGVLVMSNQIKSATSLLQKGVKTLKGASSFDEFKKSVSIDIRKATNEQILVGVLNFLPGGGLVSTSITNINSWKEYDAKRNEIKICIDNAKKVRDPLVKQLVDLTLINQTNIRKTCDKARFEIDNYLRTYCKRGSVSNLENKIDDFENFSYTISPNPTTNDIIYFSSNNENLETVKLFDLSGKKVKTVNYNYNTSVSIDDLIKGFYIVVFYSSDNQALYSSKLVVE